MEVTPASLAEHAPPLTASAATNGAPPTRYFVAPVPGYTPIKLSVSPARMSPCSCACVYTALLSLM